MKEFESIKNPFENLKNFIEFETMKSSGPGGQRLQKKETKVRAILDIEKIIKIMNLAPEQIKNLNDAYPQGYIEAISQESRSQSQNKETAVQKVLEKLDKALEIKKERKIKTKETSTAKEKRISGKKKRSEIKKLREKLKPDNYE